MLKNILKIILFIILTILVLLTIIYLFFFLGGPKTSCNLNGGEWREFSNGCADECNTGPFCTDGFTDSCDCGENKCWNGFMCISSKK